MDRFTGADLTVWNSDWLHQISRHPNYTRHSC